MSNDKINSNQKFSNLAIEYALLFACLSALFYFLFSTTFQAQFALIDDHQILNIASEKIDFPAVWNSFISNITKGGRFRPGYVIFYFGEVALFGVNPMLWHLPGQALRSS